MQSEAQVLNGLTGAIIVEGIGKFNKRAAQLPERVFVLRDMDLSKSFPNDNQQPAKDISINSVPIRYIGENVPESNVDLTQVSGDRKELTLVGASL